MEKRTSTLTASTSSPLNQRYVILLSFIWLCVQFFLLYSYGVETKGEAEKYIREAYHFLSSGKVTTSNFWLYSVQIFIIAIVLKLKTRLWSVVLVQYIFNGIATCYFYKFTCRISDSITGFFITLLFILNLPLQTFNSFLQTESLFYSLTIIYSCHLLQLKKLSAGNCISLLLFLTLLCFVRPAGLFYIPCTFLYLFFNFFKTFSIVFRISTICIITVAFLFFVNIALGSGGELDFMLPFRSECIICGTPTLPYPADIKISQHPNSVSGLFYYVINNIRQFSRLSIAKTQAFFGLYRPYFATAHNLYLILYFYPLYFLSIFSIKGWFLSQKKNIAIYCLSLISITWLAVILSCDDWHNRFFLSVVPYIYILAAPALKSLMYNLISRIRKK